jgi:hypothetical protein
MKTGAVFFTKGHKFISMRTFRMYCPIWVKFGTRELRVLLLSICDFVKIGAMKTILGGAQMEYLRVYRDTDTLNVMNTLVKSL